MRDFIEIEIEDDGVGIKEEQIQNLFQLFGVQKGNKDKKNIGLGLTIS